MSTMYECPLGLSAQTLAAWRDEFLPIVEARRIAAHVRECDACRARLAEFERLAHPLQAERAPEPDERLWLAIRAGLARTPQRMGPGWNGMGGMGGGGAHRRTWGTLAAVAAVVLLAVGFASLFGVLRPGRETTGKPTPTASRTVAPRVSPTASATAKSGAVQWQTATWPHGENTPGSPVAVAPSDGNTVYLCEPGASATDNQQIWVTHTFAAPNHGVRWTHAGDLPIAHQSVNACMVIVDENTPSTLLAIVVPQTGTAPRNFASFDGGATWHEIAQQPLYFSGNFLSGLASFRGKYYAIANTIQPTYPQFGDYTIRVSSDQMQTWQPIPTANRFDAFWLNPGNGELLAHDSNSRQFVFSDDGGATWHAFQNPVEFDTYAFVVQPPVADQSWVVCGLALPSGASSSQGPTHTAVCTEDLGKTYTTLPDLPDTPAGASDPAGDMQLIGITHEGNDWSVLAIQGTQSKVPQSNPGYTLWRLPPGGKTWQSLGIPPQYGVWYRPGSLFAQPENMVVMRPCATCAADQSDYVAGYP